MYRREYPNAFYQKRNQTTKLVARRNFIPPAAAAAAAGPAEDGGDGDAAAGDAAAVPAGAMVDSDGRILDQSEIDSLLGFDEGGGEGTKTGIMELINSALVNYERLPMLDVVFDHLVRYMSTSLHNLT